MAAGAIQSGHPGPVLYIRSRGVGRGGGGVGGVGRPPLFGGKFDTFPI